MNRSALSRTAIIAGPVVALLVGSATSAVRDQVGATNVGIALALVVVLAALAGRGAALTTAAGAALTFNFFHTQPYHSLRIHSSKDVTIVALLAGLGLVVSDISAWMRRRDTIDRSRRDADDAPRALRELLGAPHPVAQVWPAIATSIMDQLTLADCRFEAGAATRLPVISRAAGRNADGDDGLILPSRGAAMPVLSDGETLGHLVVAPRHGITSLWVERRVVVAMADHLAIALTYTGHRVPHSSARD